MLWENTHKLSIKGRSSPEAKIFIIPEVQVKNQNFNLWTSDVL
jgi:hypothetical protein